MTYYIHTLGCKVNTYESNVMADLLENRGLSRGTLENADIVIVNTCCVTNVAEHKSLQSIRKCAKDGRLLIVTGCLSQMKTDVVSMIPNVKIVLGNQGKSKILEYIDQYEQDQIIDVKKMEEVPFEDMRLNNFDKTRAFVKIQDGCNNFCSYCIIPYTRGNVRSKRKEDVLNEIITLVKNGHQEIVLTGIHTGNYGVEFQDYHFADLLKDIVKIKGLKRLRISSIEITEINEQVLEVIKDSNILVDHMHIPLQAGSNVILEKMNRKYDVDYFLDKIKQIRKIRPNMSITTDVIVGFPYEKEELFKETIDTIKKVKFTKLHVFPFSVREGTKAASMQDGFIKEEVKKERVKVLLELSKQLEQEYMEGFIGQVVDFIPEVYKDGFLIGHSGNYLLLKVKGDKTLLHQFLSVQVDQILYPYCFGKIIPDTFDKKQSLFYNESR